MGHVFERLRHYVNSRPALKRTLASALAWGEALGLDVRKLSLAALRLPRVVRQYVLLRDQMRVSGERWALRFNRPCLYDWQDQSGHASGHYFHQDLLVA